MSGPRLTALATAVAPTVLVFLMVGPLAGYFAFMAPSEWLAQPDGFLRRFAGLIPISITFAYFVGSGPALLTGLAVAAADLTTDLKGYRPFVASAVGAAITLIVFRNEIAGEADGALKYGGLALAGAVAAAICAMLAPRRVLLDRAT
jgi:hypothetical protein